MSSESENRIGVSHLPEPPPAYVRHHTGLDLPDEATDIRVHRDRVRHQPVGSPVKKLVPDERYSLFRNPTYTEIEDRRYVSEVMVTWQIGEERFCGWAQLKDPR